MTKAPDGVILFNGATGGIGRAVARRAIDLGTPNRVIASRLESPQDLSDELARLAVDGPVTFLHLAALVSVRACQADPARARLVNVQLAGASLDVVIRWAADRGLPLRVIYVSTGHVYAPPTEPGRRIAEDWPRAPRSVYARTKAEAEQLFIEASAVAGVPLVIARVFGLLAERQDAAYVLPALIDRVRRRDVDGIPGLDNVRDYLDARDVARGLDLLGGAALEVPSTVVNLCSGVPLSIRELLACVARTVSPGKAEELLERARPGPSRADDIPWLVGDPSRFTELTGNVPQTVPLSDSVESAVRASLR